MIIMKRYTPAKTLTVCNYVATVIKPFAILIFIPEVGPV